MKQQKAPCNAREAAGDWLKFEITEVEASGGRPHGLDRTRACRARHPVRGHRSNAGRSLMKHFKVQGHASLREEMKAVARGERLAPKDAGARRSNPSRRGC